MADKLASQAGSRYNVSNKILCVAAMLEASRDVSRYWIGVPTMDSLSPHASNGNIPAASGIYKITCTANKKIYIGSAVNLRKRKSEHVGKLRRNKHCNPSLQSAWNKYGEQAFIFEIVEFVLPMSLTAREQYWFNKLKPFGRKGFNVAPEAGSRLGAKHSPEARERMKQAALLRGKPSPEHMEKLRQANLGKKHSPEHIAKRVAANTGKELSPESIEKMRQAQLGKKHTPETREKISQVQLGKKHSPETKERMSLAHTGKKRSPESAAKGWQTRRAKQKQQERTG